ANPAGLATVLEPPPGPAKLTQRYGRVVAGETRELERGQRTRRVQTVVLARHGELEVDRLQLSSPNDMPRGQTPGPGLKGLVHLGRRRKGRVMVEVDIRDDGDLGGERKDGAVGLVAFDDEPTRAGAGVASELRHLAADEKGRVEPEPVEDECDHGRRGRL